MMRANEFQEASLSNKIILPDWYPHGHLAPIVPQHHYRHRHPSGCMAVKKKLWAGDLNCTSLSLRGDRVHLRMSLEVLSLSESQVDLSSNEDSAVMQAVTEEGVTQRCHCRSGTLIFLFHWDGIIRGRDGHRDGGLNQTRQWDGNDIFRGDKQRCQTIIFLCTNLRCPCYTSPNVTNMPVARWLCRAWLGFINVCWLFNLNWTEKGFSLKNPWPLCQNRWKVKVSFWFTCHQCMNGEPISVWHFPSLAESEMLKVYEA